MEGISYGGISNGGISDRRISNGGISNGGTSNGGISNGGISKLLYGDFRQCLLVIKCGIISNSNNINQK